MHGRCICSEWRQGSGHLVLLHRALTSSVRSDMRKILVPRGMLARKLCFSSLVSWFMIAGRTMISGMYWNLRAGRRPVSHARCRQLALHDEGPVSRHWGRLRLHHCESATQVPEGQVQSPWRTTACNKLGPARTPAPAAPCSHVVQAAPRAGWLDQASYSPWSLCTAAGPAGRAGPGHRALAWGGHNAAPAGRTPLPLLLSSPSPPSPPSPLCSLSSSSPPLPLLPLPLSAPACKVLLSASWAAWAPSGVPAAHGPCLAVATGAHLAWSLPVPLRAMAFSASSCPRRILTSVMGASALASLGAPALV